MKRVFFRFVFLFCLVAFPLGARAALYQVRFQYDEETGKLVFDTSSDSPASVSQGENMTPMEFAEIGSSGPFDAVFFFDDGTEIARRKFDPSQEGRPLFVLNAPYFSFAKTLRVYKVGIEEPILSLDLSEFITCDRDGTCEYEKGENFNTCIPDCVGVTVAFSDETRKLLAQNNDVIKDAKTGEILLQGIKRPVLPSAENAQETLLSGMGITTVVLSVAAIILIIGGAGILVVLKRRNRKYGL